MILTELDKVVLLAITAGFLGGSLQSIADHVIRTKLERQKIGFNRFLNRFLFLSLAGSVIFGIGIFVSASWDTSLSASELNESSFSLAIVLGTLPIVEKLLSFVFTQLKRIWAKLKA